MQTGTLLADTPVQVDAQTASRLPAPWHCRAMVLAALFILIGIVWDISWHSAIGRDTFWTPAHICIHLGGTLGGLVSGWLVLRTTLVGSLADKAAAVRVWGFRGPLGAWVTIWGALAMLTSAPLDNWWHDAYGLDVKILSPPHSVLAAGMYFHVVGGLLLVLSLQNRAAAESQGQGHGRWLFAIAGGILLCLAATMVTEEALPNQQHTALFYKICCGLFPFFLVALGRAGKLTWPTTSVAAIYLGLMCGAVWILPLFPAQPMLAPIYNRVTHMVPPAFPLLLVVPAVVMDLAFRLVGANGNNAPEGWRQRLRGMLLVLLLATIFTGLFVATQWHFSKHLISPEAKNWFFAGSGFFTFADGPGPNWHRFWGLDRDPLTGPGLLIAWLLAVASSGAGLAVGNWMAKVRR